MSDQLGVCLDEALQTAPHPELSLAYHSTLHLGLFVDRHQEALVLQQHVQFFLFCVCTDRPGQIPQCIISLAAFCSYFYAWFELTQAYRHKQL